MCPGPMPQRTRPRPNLHRFCLAALLFVFCGPSVVVARLGTGAVLLTNESFAAFVHKADRVMVDFFDRSDEDWQSTQFELDAAVRQVRDLGCSVPVGKVDAAAQTILAQQFVANRRLPQLLWFLHGEATQYHRTLRTQKHISDFMLALDRNPIVAVKDDAQVKNYNRAVLAHTKRATVLYKALEVVASKHLDTIAFLVREGPEDNVTYITDEAAPSPYTGEVSVPAIEAWVRSLLIKSEALPEETPVEGEPVVVVGKTFEKMVLRDDKDVLILIYAPWCGHSRKVFPVWEVLAKATTHVSHLVVAKMDGDRNSSPLPDTYSWEAYPTILFVKAGNRTPSVFHGNRTIAGLVGFANEHGSAPFSVDEKVMLEDEDSLSGLGEL